MEYKSHLPGLAVLLYDVIPLATVSSFEVISSPGVPINNISFHALALKLNIVLWPTQPHNLPG